MTDSDTVPAVTTDTDTVNTGTVDDHDCHNCGHATDISTEQLKAVTDRLDALNANLTWICQVVHGMLTNIPRSGVAGIMVNKVLRTNQGQAPHGN
jgi:hypothetical protein